MSSFDVSWLEPVLIAMGLSIAAGFRVFVPFWVLSGGALFVHLPLDSDLLWLDTYPVFIALSLALVIELLSYSIPWLDNATDLLALPAAAIAGTILMGSAADSLEPFWRWSLAIVAGGGSAAAIKSVSGLGRLFSTATTGGLGNILIALGELFAAMSFSWLALLFPLLTVAFAIATGIVIVFLIRRQRIRPSSS
ncbi:MAG: DUF4126 domain-containing protein [Cyanobacteria bacterium P01_H01_bin.15]